MPGEMYKPVDAHVIDDLRKIAAVSELNAFVPVGTRNFDLGEVYRRVVVPRVNFQEELESEAVPLPSRQHGFAIAALALLLIESLLHGGPQPRVVVPVVRTERGAAA